MATRKTKAATAAAVVQPDDIPSFDVLDVTGINLTPAVSKAIKVKDKDKDVDTDTLTARIGIVSEILAIAPFVSELELDIRSRKDAVYAPLAARHVALRATYPGNRKGVTHDWGGRSKPYRDAIGEIYVQAFPDATVRETVKSNVSNYIADALSEVAPAKELRLLGMTAADKAKAAKAAKVKADKRAAARKSVKDALESTRGKLSDRMANAVVTLTEESVTFETFDIAQRLNVVGAMLHDLCNRLTPNDEHQPAPWASQEVASGIAYVSARLATLSDLFDGSEAPAEDDDDDDDTDN